MIRSEEKFGLDKGWYEDKSNWHSFNDFFSRKLADPSARPIASPDDPTIVCTPADALPQASGKSLPTVVSMLMPLCRRRASR